MARTASFVFFTLLQLGAQSLASPTPEYTGHNTSDYRHPPNGLCTDYSVKQDLTTENYVYSFPPFASNFDVASFLFNLSRKDYATAFHPLAGTVNVTKEYQVEGTFCTPKSKNGKENTVLLATHGVAFDRRYWASSFQPEEYSFVDYALNHGYSVFYYDRIGAGKSAIVSGYENQASNQIAFLGGIAKAIRSGSYTSDIRASKVVLLGHSFGSYVTNVLLTTDPSVADGAILTGFSYPNASDASRFQLGDTTSAFPTRLAPSMALHENEDTDSGTLILASLYGLAQTFFHAPHYATAAVEYAFSITSRFAVGEPLTFGIADLRAPDFHGPVLVTTGENDIPVCGGECVSTYEGGLQEEAWPGASPLETYLHPGVGHGLNFGANATGFYDVVVRFLDAHF